MLTIQIEDVVIKTNRFIYAEIASSKLIKIYLKGLPEGRNFVSVNTKNFEESKKLLEEINNKMNKKA